MATRSITGQIQEPVDVDDLLAVQGSVEAGGAIRGTLMVQGATGGRFQLETGAVMHVQGAASGFFSLAEGSNLVVAGVWTGTITRHDGRVLLAVGTVLTNPPGSNRPGVLQADGTLVTPDSGANMSVNVTVDADHLIELGADGMLYTMEKRVP